MTILPHVDPVVHELLTLLYDACEYVAKHSYVCCDECVYQRFLETELNARFRSRFGASAPAVQREVSMHQVFRASDGTPVMCPAPRTDLLVLGTEECPDMIIELKATAKVTSHMCYQANKYAHMFRDSKRPPTRRAAPLVFLVNFLQPDNETLFSGPTTATVGQFSTIFDEGVTTPPKKRAKQQLQQPARVAACADDEWTYHALTRVAPDPIGPLAQPLTTGPPATLRMVPLNHPVIMNSTTTGPGLFFFAGWPQDDESTSVTWRRYAKIP